MENGFVNFYDHVKGYGFIRRERGRDVFFRYDDFLFLVDLPLYFQTPVIT